MELRVFAPIVWKIEKAKEEKNKFTCRHSSSQRPIIVLRRCQSAECITTNSFPYYDYIQTNCVKFDRLVIFGQFVDASPDGF